MFQLASQAQPMPPDVLFLVHYADETYWAGEGDSTTFGRDPEQVELVLWEEIRFQGTSRTTGRLWVMEGEMWVRNLSHHHELVVSGPHPPVVLAPRPSGSRGNGCSVRPGATIQAPSAGAWSLQVECSIHHPVNQPTRVVRGQATIVVPAVPAQLHRCATAMCTPLLLGHGTAATYQQIARATDYSYAAARDHVSRLLQFYEEHFCAAGDRQPLRPQRPNEPLYQPLAELLVQRGLITEPHPGLHQEHLKTQ